MAPSERDATSNRLAHLAVGRDDNRRKLGRRGFMCRCWGPSASPSGDGGEKTPELAALADGIYVQRQLNDDFARRAVASEARVKPLEQQLPKTRLWGEVQQTRLKAEREQVDRLKLRLEQEIAAKTEQEKHKSTLSLLHSDLEQLKSRELVPDNDPDDWREGHERLLDSLRAEKSRLSQLVKDRTRLNKSLQEDVKALRDSVSTLMELGDRQTFSLSSLVSQNDRLADEAKKTEADDQASLERYWDHLPSGGSCTNVVELREKVDVAEVEIAALERRLGSAKRMCKIVAAEVGVGKSFTRDLLWQSLEISPSCSSKAGSTHQAENGVFCNRSVQATSTENSFVEASMSMKPRCLEDDFRLRYAAEVTPVKEGSSPIVPQNHPPAVGSPFPATNLPMQAGALQSLRVIGETQAEIGSNSLASSRSSGKNICTCSEPGSPVASLEMVDHPVKEMLHVPAETVNASSISSPPTLDKKNGSSELTPPLEILSPGGFQFPRNEDDLQAFHLEDTGSWLEHCSKAADPVADQRVEQQRLRQEIEKQYRLRDERIEQQRLRDEIAWRRRLKGLPQTEGENHGCVRTERIEQVKFEQSQLRAEIQAARDRVAKARKERPKLFGDMRPDISCLLAEIEQAYANVNDEGVAGTSDFGDDAGNIEPLASPGTTIHRAVEGTSVSADLPLFASPISPAPPGKLLSEPVVSFASPQRSFEPHLPWQPSTAQAAEFRWREFSTSPAGPGRSHANSEKCLLKGQGRSHAKFAGGRGPLPNHLAMSASVPNWACKNKSEPFGQSGPPAVLPAVPWSVNHEWDKLQPAWPDFDFDSTAKVAA